LTCHGGFSLDEATRRSWYNPEQILKDAGLAAGMVFIDVGSSEGFFSLLAAKMVGGSGIVYAVDSDFDAIERLKAEAERQHFSNIRVKAAAAEETVFCNACADVVFYSMDLHDFRDAVRVLQNAKKMIKPTGVLVDLDWKKQMMQFGPPFKIRFSEQDAQGLLKITGFKVTSVLDAGPYHYVVLAKSSENCQG
jgi:ubiquinone/menaquinone biosynthesis C-methylase UbiE